MTTARSCLILLAALSVFAPAAAPSQERERVVVIPFTGDAPAADQQTVTQLFEQALFKLDSFQVIDRAQQQRVFAYIDQSLLSCADEECAIKVAEALSAGAVILGTVSGLEGALQVSATLVDSIQGKSVAAASARAASADDFPRIVPGLLSTLLEKRPLPAPIAPAPPVDADKLRQEKLHQEALLKLQGLESLRAELKATIAATDKKRSLARTWGWALVGGGAVSAVLSGVSWLVAARAYQNYRSTADTAAAERYRTQVTAWDTIMLLTAGTGVLSIGGSISFFALSPDSKPETEQLKRIEGDIGALEQAEGISK